MKKSEIIAHFGTQRVVANMLDIEQPSIAAWSEDDVPGYWQLILEKLTQGDLKASPEAYDDIISRVHIATRGLVTLTREQIDKNLKKLKFRLVLAE